MLGGVLSLSSMRGWAAHPLDPHPPTTAFRHNCVVAACSGEGPFVKRTAVPQAQRREPLFMPEAVLKRAGATNAQHYFLYSGPQIAVFSIFSFQIREIEKSFLRAI
jgi:hypothetical protein